MAISQFLGNKNIPISILQLLEFEKSSTPSFVICDQDAKI